MTKTNKKIKIGIIGCGRMARLFHMPPLLKNPNVDILAIADPNTSVLESVSKKYKIPEIYQNYDELIEKSSIDAVLICTPPWLHADPTIKSAKKGIAVFCEKPMAVTVEDCDEMVNACKEANVPLAIGFIRRFDSGFQRVKEIIKSGAIGEVFQMDAFFNMYVPDIEQQPFKRILEWAKKHLKYDVENKFGIWRIKDTRVGGGIFQDHAPHYVDLFRWLIDDDIAEVSGFVRKMVQSRAYEDHAISIMRFKSGCTAYLEISLDTVDGRGLYERGYIHGSKGSISFNTGSWWFIASPPISYLLKNRIKIYPLSSVVLNNWRRVRVKGGRKHFMGNRQMEHFISILQNGKNILNNNLIQTPLGEDGKKAMEVVLATYKSSAEGKMIHINQ